MRPYVRSPKVEAESLKNESVEKVLDTEADRRSNSKEEQSFV